jgi:hypothetical protein
MAHQGPGVEEPHDVSRDGKWLLFIEYRPPVDADIKVLPLSPSGEPRVLAATPFQELWPRFSPDGRQVAYASDLSGRSEVYVRLFEGAAAPRRISKNGGTRPRWNPNGQELFFLAPGGRLMTVARRASSASRGCSFKRRRREISTLPKEASVFSCTSRRDRCSLPFTFWSIGLHGFASEGSQLRLKTCFSDYAMLQVLLEADGAR